jgi:hypothetical protein
MNTKYTPGPWINHGRITQPGLPHSAVAAKTLIARVYSEAFGDEAQEVANARLIAAAPELLDFALLVLSGIESGHIKAKPFLDMNALVGDSIPMRTIGDAAREVLAKATGEKA